MRQSTKILVVAYHYPPDPAIGGRRPSALAAFLAARNSEVHVMAASVEGAAARCSQSDRTIVRRWTVPPDPTQIFVMLKNWLTKRTRPSGQSLRTSSADAEQPSLIARLREIYDSFEQMFDNQKLWSALLFFRMLPTLWREKFDVAVVTGPPMSSMIATVLACKIFKVPVILDFRDPWGVHLNSRLDWIATRIELWFYRMCLRSASALVCASPGTLNLVNSAVPQMRAPSHLVLNGFDQLPSDMPAPPVGELRLLYCGTLYLNRDPFPLLRAIKGAIESSDIDRTKVSVTLVGDCEQWGGTSVLGWAEENGLQDIVTVVPPVPADQLRQYYCEANVLINFAQGQKPNIPAKTYEYMALGRESLVLTEADSDTCAIVHEAKCGICVDPADAAQLTDAVMGLYRKYVLANSTADVTLPVGNIRRFDRRVQCEKFEEIILATRRQRV